MWKGCGEWASTPKRSRAAVFKFVGVCCVSLRLVAILLRHTGLTGEVLGVGLHAFACFCALVLPKSLPNVLLVAVGRDRQMNSCRFVQRDLGSLPATFYVCSQSSPPGLQRIGSNSKSPHFVWERDDGLCDIVACGRQTFLTRPIRWYAGQDGDAWERSFQEEQSGFRLRNAVC